MCRRCDLYAAGKKWKWFKFDVRWGDTPNNRKIRLAVYRGKRYARLKNKDRKGKIYFKTRHRMHIKPKR